MVDMNVFDKVAELYTILSMKEHSEWLNNEEQKIYDILWWYLDDASIVIDFNK